MDEAGGPLVETDELVGGDVAAQVGAAGAQGLDERFVPLRADDDERHPDGPRSGERGERVLARLDAAHEEEIAVVAAVRRAELRAGSERRDGDLLRGDAVELDEVVARPLRNGEHVRGATRRPWHDELEDRALARSHRRRVALEGEILHGEHSRAREPRRDRVHEVREARPEAPQQARHRPQHAQLLHLRVELDRADAVGHEVGPACDGREIEVARQCAQQLAHVRLVAGATAPEEVGVDDDHAASSYAWSRSFADASHE